MNKSYKSVSVRIIPKDLILVYNFVCVFEMIIIVVSKEWLQLSENNETPDQKMKHTKMMVETEGRVLEEEEGFRSNMSKNAIMQRDGEKTGWRIKSEQRWESFFFQQITTLFLSLSLSPSHSIFFPIPSLLRSTFVKSTWEK